MCLPLFCPQQAAPKTPAAHRTGPLRRSTDGAGAVNHFGRDAALSKIASKPFDFILLAYLQVGPAPGQPADALTQGWYLFTGMVVPKEPLSPEGEPTAALDAFR